MKKRRLGNHHNQEEPMKTRLMTKYFKDGVQGRVLEQKQQKRTLTEDHGNLNNV